MNAVTYEVLDMMVMDKVMSINVVMVDDVKELEE